MRLTLQQLEDVFLHPEIDAPIFPCVWSMLYLAARNNGIEAIEALRIISYEAYCTSTFIANFLCPSDVEEVKKHSFTLGLQSFTPHCGRAISKRMLDSWIAKTLMLEVVHRSDRRTGQLNEE
jgi:hypothetical protein